MIERRPGWGGLCLTPRFQSGDRFCDFVAGHVAASSRLVVGQADWGQVAASNVGQSSQPTTKKYERFWWFETRLTRYSRSHAARPARS